MMLSRFASRCGVLCVVAQMGMIQVSSFVPSIIIPLGPKLVRSSTTNVARAVLLRVSSKKTAAVNGSQEDDDDDHALDEIQNLKTGPTTTSTAFLSSRRDALLVGTLPLFGAVLPVVGGGMANAAVTDETDRFGDNWWTKGIPSSGSSSPFVDAPTTKTARTSSATIAAPAPTDEVTIQISKKDLTKQGGGGLGIELGEIEFQTNIRVVVKSVLPGSLADQLGIQKDWIVVGIDGQGTERTNAEGVALMVYRAARKESSAGGEEFIAFQFRDPAGFRNQLTSLGRPTGATAAEGSSSSNEPRVVTTQVAPSGDTTSRNADGSVQVGRSVTTQDDQRLTVSQLVPPKLCRRGADIDDLLEISYLGTVVETGAIFDGSAVKINGEGIPGRGNDVSIFFVLGKQPFGQFPPGWDVGLYGICVGERRRLLVPPALAYGATGLPRRGIPPNSTLQYDVTLVSLNGLAMPQ